jgi:hypothetical protein
MATFSVQHMAVWAALGAMLAHSEERLDSKITILVYDYAGVQPDTLRKAEQETSRIFRHSGVEVTAALPDTGLSGSTRVSGAQSDDASLAADAAVSAGERPRTC